MKEIAIIWRSISENKLNDDRKNLQDVILPELKKKINKPKIFINLPNPIENLTTLENFFQNRWSVQERKKF